MTSLEAPGVRLDEAVTEEFAGRVLGIFNDACIALLTSVGHQTGLFDTLAPMAPSTSAEIATAAGLNERYVREWLNGMTTARFVVHDSAGRYSLPPEHAASLTTAAGPDNLAPLTGYVAMLGEVEQQIVSKFRDGGGVPYSQYPRFQATRADESAAMFDASLVDAILPVVDGLPDKLAAGIDVADVGCGSGHAVNVMARAFPTSRFVGYDFSEDGIAAARGEAEVWGLANARFEVLDVATLDMEGAFDLVTAFDAIHDQAHPAAVLAGISRSLRPDGTFLMVDIKASSDVDRNVDIPWAGFLYAISTFHCMTVSLALDGDGLGTAWGRELATTMLDDAGFTSVEVRETDDDPFNYYYVARFTDG